MKDKVHGALLGVAIGDALGMPVETLTGVKIRERLGRHGVTGFIDPMQTRIDDTKHMVAGDTTDDWQLTEVVLRSLIDFGRFNDEHQILAHCNALKSSTFGWGKGTIRAIQEIIDKERVGYTAPAREAGTGLGNGVMMKIAPLALYHALRLHKQGLNPSLILISKPYTENVRALGAITHGDPRAWISAYAVGLFIVAAASGALETATERHWWQCRVAETLEILESFYVDNPKERVLGKSLAEVHMHAGSSERLVERYGCGFVATETLPFVIGTFLRHPSDFRAGVLDAVNAGGDTDTNASIVGALIGANVGAKGVPDAWKNFRAEFGRAITLGDELVALFS